MAQDTDGLTFVGSHERLEALAVLAERHTKLKAAQNACTMLANDVMLLAMGVRTAVLIDYLPPKLVPGKLQECVQNLVQAGHEFAALHVCCLSEGNYLLINLPFFAARLRSSVDQRLADIELVDCSSRLSDPTHLGLEAKAELLPAFNIICGSIDEYVAKLGNSFNPSCRPKQTLNLKGDSCGAPLPTLAGWILEYPVVYFVDDPLSGNCLPEQDLLLFRFEIPGRSTSESGNGDTCDGQNSTSKPSELAQAGKVGEMLAGHHVLSFTVPEELYGEAEKRAVRRLTARIAHRVVGEFEADCTAGEELTRNSAMTESGGGERELGAEGEGVAQRRKREREEGEPASESADAASARVGEGASAGDAAAGGRVRWRRTLLPEMRTRSISCHVVAL